MTSSIQEKAFAEDIHVESVNIPGSPADDVAFTDRDAKRVRRKLDFWILPILMITYGLQYWDKSLAGQAVQFNYAKDLHLIQVTGHTEKGVAITSTKRLANTTIIFYIGYLVCVYPAVILTQKFPVSKVCGVAIFLWAVVIMSTAACKSYGTLLVNRFFLGCLESFVAPTFVVYITFWWTRQEQSMRSSLWWGMVGVAGMITPLIAWGLGHIHGAFGDSTWKYMFLTAGSVTALWSFVFLWALPDNPRNAKWLNERDRAIVLARIKSDNAGTIEPKWKTAHVWEALLSFNLWSNAFISLSVGIPNAVFSSFGTLVISGFGYSKFDSLLLLMPLGFTAAVSVYVTGYIGQQFKNMRYLMLMFCSVVALTGSLMAWLAPRDAKSVLYAGVVLMTFIIGASSIAIGLTSANCAGHTKKSMTSGAVFIGYCVGNIAGPYCFTSTPGPNYSGGFISCVVVNAVDVLISMYGFWLYRRENRRRDVDNGAPAVIHALEDLTDFENKDFRYVY